MSKLTREEKIEIFERRKMGETISSLTKAFNIRESNIKYLIALIKKHGYNILREDKNRVYSKDFKLQAINRILINHESINSVAIDIGLTSSGILDNWLSKFKENGYNVVEKKKGRKPKSMTKLKKNDKEIKRNFEATAPNQKWFTDVTEFNLRGEKLYLSPILDAYGRYIVSYDISRSANLEQINHMLNLAFKENESYENLIFHSDQGWQYQHSSYQKRLKEKKITQSMSRKGNSLDNGLMECFFGLLKSEMFYEQEEKYKTLEELKEAIEDYIYYYNNKRIKEKLKGLTPASYRSQSLLVS
ncbi:IS3 family transposase [Fusobacterium animalis]|uniref:Integrase catalytic domain-containing protein n=1 Tax=Fusobacterium animalis TaxID=76859 RepID=A0A0M5MBQ6_9FUSO|nr:IS3 family transposase [Fusobacterium animalis]ALF17501.1 hypothetical protein RN98_04720 [Fusobacterium animalis]